MHIHIYRHTCTHTHTPRTHTYAHTHTHTHTRMRSRIYAHIHTHSCMHSYAAHVLSGIARYEKQGWLHLNRADEGIQRIARRLRTMNTHYARAISSSRIPNWAAAIQARTLEILSPETQSVDSPMPTEDPALRRRRKASSLHASEPVSTNPTAASSREPPPAASGASKSKRKSQPKTTDAPAATRARVSDSSSALPSSSAPSPTAAVPIAAARVYDDLASIPPSRFLPDGVSSLFYSTSVPALTADGIIAGVAPPAHAHGVTALITEPTQLAPAAKWPATPPTNEEEASTDELAPPERYQPANIVQNGFTTRRGAWIELSDGLRVFSTKKVEVPWDTRIYFEFVIAGESQVCRIDSLNAGNLGVALASILPKYGEVLKKKHCSLFEGIVIE